MKVLHVIPNAFDYFEDIHSESFKILEAEADFGVEASAITIEYGAVTRKQVFEVKKTAPSRRYAGQEPFEKNIADWDFFDIINLHCPFFGEAGKMLKWIKNYPDKKFIITYHHDFQCPDFFSYFIKFYNYYYLPKLFKAAQFVVFFAERYDESQVGIKMLKNKENIAVLGLVEEGEDIHNVSIVEDLVIVYNSLMSN
ncbi:MAG: hypothetical protein WCV83_03550 [Candidatus Magasanikbacteria bacterium]|jgi:hypothetical protein